MRVFGTAAVGVAATGRFASACYAFVVPLEPRTEPETEPLQDPLVASAPANAAPKQPSSAWKVAVAAIGAATLAAAVTMAVKPTNVSLLPPATTTVTEVAPTPDVVLAIQNLAKLESVTFHMERVVDLADKQKRLYGLVEAKDAILLVAVGDVIAGCDLSQIKREDVTSNFAERRVSVRLPAPKVLSASLDEKATHVFSRSTDTLAARHEDLEARARQEALRTMQKAAEEQGIQDKARASAEGAVRGLLEAAGFKEIDISFEE
jgi:uncharacterized protein DUF4230